MAYLTVVVPSYNSENYLARCLDSLLPQKEKLDVIIVNDGSTDRTAEIGQSYVDRWPQNFRLINKENGGHGSGINVGIELAAAPWFKVLDSDDHFAAEGLNELLRLIADFENKDSLKPDLIISDFIYEVHRNKEDGQEEVINKRADYQNVFRERGFCSWSRIRSFRYDQMLMMHALGYRTEILRKIKLELPEKTYYEDNIYVYEPLPHVRRIYYLNEPVYVYYIGRDDQSINMGNVVKNVNMQIFVTEEMLRRVRLETVRPQRLQRYMFRHLARMVAMCMMPLALLDSGESKQKIALLWQELENINPVVAKKLRATPMLSSQRLLAKAGSYLNQQVYNLISKAFVLGGK